MINIFVPKINGISLNIINSDIIDSLSKIYSVETCFWTKASLQNYDLLIQHYSANPKKYKFKSNKKILIQPVDGTLIDPKHVEDIDQYDLIITPATSNKKILEDSGIKSDKIKIIPNYWSDEILINNNFYDQKFKSDKYTFYTETTGIRRKNVKNLIKYFVETFQNNDDVRLVVKLSGIRQSVFSDIRSILSEYEKIPEIHFINEFLDINDLYSIMNGINCYICLSYMEGFCMPLLNAAVLKKDIITFNSSISGYTDFLDHENAILLTVNKITIDQKGESILIYSKESEWEEPDYNDYKVALIDCYKGSYKFNKHHDFSKFSKEVVMNQYLEVVKNILEK